MRHLRPRGRLLALVLGAAVLAAPVAPAVQAQQAGPTGYVIQPGDTLWQIAADAGTDTSTLLRLNGLEDGDAIIAGQTLNLPGSAPAAAVSPPAPTQVMHTVAAGESLWEIAATYATTADAIATTNGIEDPNQIRAGIELKIPSVGAAEVSRPTAAPQEAPSAIPAPSAATGRKTLTTSYTVQPGESLSRIAQQFDTTVDAIAQASGLPDPNRIGVGAVLKVPVPGREHVVQAGETLYRIAATEKVDMGLLIDFNEIPDPALLRVGTVLVIPAPAIQTTANVSPTPAPSPEPTPAPPSAQPQAAPSTPAPTSAPPKQPTPTPTPPPTPRAKATIPPGTSSDGLVGAATKLVGMAYVFGGSGPTAFDCSGLVWYAAKQIGKPLSRGIRGQYDAGSHPARDQLKPGDLVFFQNTYMPGLSHNGIYIGNNLFIHAADEAQGVTISNMGAEYWSSRYFGATRPG